jgi:hypothetical protein
MNDDKPNWTVTTRERDLQDPMSKGKRTTVFEHSLCYQGKKVHSLTGDNGLTILTETAQRYNEENYLPDTSTTKLLFELSGSQRKKLDDLWAKSVPDLFPMESEVKA